MPVTMLACCANNFMFPAVFFGSDEEEDYTEYCRLTGANKFRSESDFRISINLECLRIIDDLRLERFVNRHKYVWVCRISGDVSNCQFRDTILGAAPPQDCRDPSLYYLWMYGVLYSEDILFRNFLSFRDFTYEEKVQATQIRESKEDEWTNLIMAHSEYLSENGFKSFMSMIDRINGYYSEEVD